MEAGRVYGNWPFVVHSVCLIPANGPICLRQVLSLAWGQCRPVTFAVASEGKAIKDEYVRSHQYLFDA
ncbi:hypothetical protein D3C76_296630 [compost metagenome]